ncbi:hypothetical protein Ana3638_07810 [Anaerocolumna sedimenticola]|uniref:UDP-N-acetylglucosamine 2-epimerase domain-containing protein n=1 Tax=Anaerocolumna sedimenticola TaxID=2696063 RepID=A0A6P1TKM7_9FIRM|nr:hypothetical protein [Anaerocolumna sedimenticola]QHQ60689.1 hypothetical protein Ana3638_07810 [Anaerocolumna sedimenticola]
MKPDETLEQFIRFEAEQEFFKLKINDINYWHYIRFFFFMAILEAKHGIINRNNYQKNAKTTNNIIKQSDKFIFKNPLFVRHKDVLVFNHPRRIKQNNFYKCVYTDEWLKECEFSYYVFEEPYLGTNLVPIKTKNIKYLDINWYGKFINLKKSKLDYKTSTPLSIIFNKLEIEFAIKFTNQQKKNIAKTMNDQIANRDFLKKCYKHILKKISPQVIILVVAYNFGHMMIIETAKEMGIPTIELEHGIIGKGHIAYNFAEKLNLESFPDYIFAFGKYDIDTPRYPINKKYIIPVGSTELEMQALNYKNKIKKRNKKVITFLSDGTTELMQCAAELSKIIDNLELEIIIKLHPSEYANWRKIYPFLLNTKIQVADDSNHNIYYYLAVSDFVVGCASTTMYEATIFDTEILIFKSGQYYRSAALVENNMAIYVSSAEEIIEYIIEPNNIKKLKKQNYFFCNNSKKLIYDAIKSILAERK